MSPLWARRTLWLVLLLTLPVPMWFIGGGRAPTLALFEIAAYLLPVWIREGGPGAQLALVVFSLQGVFWTAVLYAVARIMVRILAGSGGEKAPVAAVAVIALCLFALSLFPVYVTPVIARGAPVNLFSVY